MTTDFTLKRAKNQEGNWSFAIYLIEHASKDFYLKIDHEKVFHSA